MQPNRPNNPGASIAILDAIEAPLLEAKSKVSSENGKLLIEDILSHLQEFYIEYHETQKLTLSKTIDEIVGRLQSYLSSDKLSFATNDDINSAIEEINSAKVEPSAELSKDDLSQISTLLSAIIDALEKRQADNLAKKLDELKDVFQTFQTTLETRLPQTAEQPESNALESEEESSSETSEQSSEQKTEENTEEQTENSEEAQISEQDESSTEPASEESTEEAPTKEATTEEPAAKETPAEEQTDEEPDNLDELASDKSLQKKNSVFIDETQILELQEYINGQVETLMTTIQEIDFGANSDGVTSINKQMMRLQNIISSQIEGLKPTSKDKKKAKLAERASAGLTTTINAISNVMNSIMNFIENFIDILIKGFTKFLNAVFNSIVLFILKIAMVTILPIILLVGAFLYLLAGPLHDIAEPVISLVNDVIGMIRDVISLVKEGFKFLRDEIWPMLKPALTELSNLFATVFRSLTLFFNGVGSVAEALGRGIAKFILTTVETLTSIMNAIKGVVDAIAKGFEVVALFFNGIAAKAEDIGIKFGNFIETTLDVLVSYLQTVKTILDSISSLIQTTVVAMLKPISKFFNAFAEKAEECGRAFGDVFLKFAKLVDKFSDMFIETLQAVGTFLKTKLGSIVNAVTHPFDTVKGWFSSDKDKKNENNPAIPQNLPISEIMQELMVRTEKLVTAMNNSNVFSQKIVSVLKNMTTISQNVAESVKNMISNNSASYIQNANFYNQLKVMIQHSLSIDLEPLRKLIDKLLELDFSKNFGIIATESVFEKFKQFKQVETGKLVSQIVDATSTANSVAMKNNINESTLTEQNQYTLEISMQQLKSDMSDVVALSNSTAQNSENLQNAFDATAVKSDEESKKQRKFNSSLMEYLEGKFTTIINKLDEDPASVPPVIAMMNTVDSSSNVASWES